jgi:predicted AAA+ superfamily ATPase
MDARFAVHNSHLIDVKNFAKLDPQLRQLLNKPYVYQSKIIEQLPIDQAGIYSLSGGRQIGKTTLLKQWMEQLLIKGINPKSIAFFSGELIDDSHALLNLLQQQLVEMPSNTMRYLLIDEVTYIKDWDKAIKYAADGGLLEEVELVITGSDLVLIKEARMRFPGRRGKANKVDFHFYPLSFYEVVKLKNLFSESIDDLLSASTVDPTIIDAIFAEFNNYLQHGGYLSVINDLAENKQISNSTLSTYSDWIRGDILKHGKQEQYLREILQAIIKRYNSQISWHSLARDLSIDHHKTVADYVELLNSMDVLFVQNALLEDKLTAAPKKAKKIFFMDPFIFHAVRAWLWPNVDPFKMQISTAIADVELTAKLVEAIAVTHYQRYYPTYYIKAEGEVDLAYINDDRFWPIEIKWTNHLHPKDLKQISKYKNGIIFTKTKTPGVINGVATEPLPIALLKLKDGV